MKQNYGTVVYNDLRDTATHDYINFLLKCITAFHNNHNNTWRSVLDPRSFGKKVTHSQSLALTSLHQVLKYRFRRGERKSSATKQKNNGIIRSPHFQSLPFSQTWEMGMWMRQREKEHRSTIFVLSKIMGERELEFCI